jgi:spore coat protein YutH
MIYDRLVEDSKSLYELNQEMLKRNALVHEIVLNKDNQILTYINNIPYILLRGYINEDKIITLPDINFINIIGENIKYDRQLERTNWVDLWANKIDFIEYQISQVGKKFPLLIDNLTYYIGMGENAISYVKNTTLELKPTQYDVLTVNHRRIRANDTAFDLYNPISFVIDNKVRDLSEYIKSNFFLGKNIWNDIYEYFNHNTLSPYSLRLLYGRLLFPSYYFDLYEQIIEEKVKEEEILSIISKLDDYEIFLDEFYHYITSNNYYLPPIPWINKKSHY